MALSSSAVQVAVTGAVSVAPIGSTAPTDASTALDAAFKDLGYIGEDGVTETRDRNSNDITAWQNGALVRTVVTSGTLQFQFTAIETNQRTIGAFYGATVTLAAAVIDAAVTGGQKMFVIDVIDGAHLERIFIPQGEIIEVGEVTYSNGEAIGYPMTIQCYRNTTIGGNAKKFYQVLTT